ncbi:MAG: FG-GAP-like repeat-containing protein [Bacteroidota bacterium]
MARWTLQIIAWLVLLAGSVTSTDAQVLETNTSIPIFHSGSLLSSPFAGGVNEPQFSAVELNADNQIDLVVFDRSGNVLIPFLRDTSSSSPYVYAPYLKASFPPLEQWALFRDYDCDGRMDLFTSHPDSNGVRLYHNDSSNGILQFSLVAELLQAQNENIYVPFSDIPAIVDVDGDTDLDILSFDPAGLHVQWYENISATPCELPQFELTDACWGNFEEAGLTNEITLGIACKRDNGTSNHPTAHAGSSIGAFDAEGDGDLEVLLGDLNHANLVLLTNGGTTLHADMVSVEPGFPTNSVPVDLRQFPASYFIDVTRDGLTDLLVAPNIPGISLNVGNVWLYRNIGSNSTPLFSFQQKDFLEETMIDLGRAAKPVFFDMNGDGLLDIVAGNSLFREEALEESSSLWVYRNAGSSTEPEFERLTTNFLQLTSLFNPPRFGFHPTFGDVDGDGDDDLVLGDESGKVHYFKNIAALGSPPSFILFAPELAGIDVGADAAPQLIDLNRDGLADLLIGERSGNLNYFENTGTQGNADFSSPAIMDFGGVDVLIPCCTGYSVPFVFENEEGIYEMVVGAESGQLFHYTNIEGNLSGVFSLNSTDYGELNEGSRASPHAADITNDGKKEWIIGNSRGGFAILEAKPPSSAPSIEPDQPLLLWPNPGTSFFNIAHSEASSGPLQIEVFDLHGTRLSRKTFFPASGHVSISTDTWPTAVYLVRATTINGRQYVQKWSLHR